MSTHLNTVKCPFVGQTFHVSSFAFHISRTIQNGRSQLVTQCKMVQDGTSSHANQVSKQVKIECPISLSKQVVNVKMTILFAFFTCPSGPRWFYFMSDHSIKPLHIFISFCLYEYLSDTILYHLALSNQLGTSILNWYFKSRQSSKQKSKNRVPNFTFKTSCKHQNDDVFWMWIVCLCREDCQDFFPLYTGQKSWEFFVCILGETMTSWINFEIVWPLAWTIWGLSPICAQKIYNITVQHFLTNTLFK